MERGLDGGARERNGLFRNAHGTAGIQAAPMPTAWQGYTAPPVNLFEIFQDVLIGHVIASL